MVKLNVPQTQVKIDFKPFELVPGNNHYDKMSRYEWHMCVIEASDLVMTAIKRFNMTR